MKNIPGRLQPLGGLLERLEEVGLEFLVALVLLDEGLDQLEERYRVCHHAALAVGVAQPAAAL